MCRAVWGSAAGVLLAIAAAAGQGTLARPGAVNFVEGQVAIEGKPLAAGALEGIEIGDAQTLSTEQGKAEVLLTPGAFLRLGDHAAIKMASRSAADPRVELLSGAASLEVVQIGPGHLEVTDGQASVTVERPGIYEFHAGGQASVAVFAGKARIVENDRSVELGQGRQLTWSGNAAAAEAKLARGGGDSLYAWSRQRSLTAAQASVNTAQSLAATNPDNWHGSGWYWNPFLGAWAFLPADYTLSGPYGDRFFSATFYHRYAAVETHSHGYWAIAE
jgi:ferric-dicitrate binding protein FerR (iron transport regulator)